MVPRAPPRALVQTVLLGAGLGTARPAQSSGRPPVDLCSLPNLVVVATVTERGPAFAAPWTCPSPDGNEPLPGLPMRAITPFTLTVDRTVAGIRYDSLVLPRTGGVAGHGPSEVRSSFTDPLLTVGERYAMALWYIPDDPECGRSPQIMAWKRLPSDLSLPPDGVLFAAWNSVCQANPVGIPPYAGWNPGHPRISPVSPVETAYPSSRYQAEMPTVALEGHSSAVHVDLPAELAIPGEVLALFDEHGVVVRARSQPAWADAVENRASTGGHADVADK